MAQAEMVDRPRVLVVDDDAALAEMLTLVLRNEGFQSEIVTRGDEAMGVFRSFRPDVVLLDLRMPELDGLELMRRALALEQLGRRGRTIERDERPVTPRRPVVQGTCHELFPRADLAGDDHR